MLQCLDRLVEQAESSGRVDARAGAELLALFTHFADGLHQEREERYLFPHLLRRARSVTERTDIGRLCGQHEEERQAMARLGRELLGAVYGEPRSLRDFLREARRFVGVQRAHLVQENRELLPLAEFLLTPEDDQAVLQGFQDLEAGGAGEPREIFQRIEELGRHLGILSAPEGDPQFHP